LARAANIKEVTPVFQETLRRSGQKTALMAAFKSLNRYFNIVMMQDRGRR
jgi:hypothetical protein